MTKNPDSEKRLGALTREYQRASDLIDQSPAEEIHDPVAQHSLMVRQLPGKAFSNIRISLKNKFVKLSLAGLLAMSSGCLNTNAQKKDYELQWPEDNPAISQYFGENKGTIYRDGHLGIDMTDHFGAPVKAAADGVVFAIGSDDCPNFEEPNCNYRYGNWVMLWHPNLEFHTVYCHLEQRTDKEVGSGVKRGETIGHEGGSGYQFDTGTLKTVVRDESRHHLHFEVGKFEISTTATIDDITDFWPRLNGNRTIEIYNPLGFLPPMETNPQDFRAAIIYDGRNVIAHE